jgi:hypothetical protein
VKQITTANHGLEARMNSKDKYTFEKVTTKDNKVQLQIIHTSPETTDIAEKVSKNLERHFKANNYMNPQKKFKEFFSGFSNEERIQFFT